MLATEHIPWPKIGDGKKARQQVWRKANRIRGYKPRRVLGGQTSTHIMGRVKLHGSNASVVIAAAAQGVEVCAQSRNRILTATEGAGSNSLLGFSTMVYQLGAYGLLAMFPALRDHLEMGTKVTIYGEWVGPKVQKSVGLSYLNQRVWVPFGLGFTDSDGITTYGTIDELVQGVDGEGVRSWQIVPINEIPGATVHLALPGGMEATSLTRELASEAFRSMTTRITEATELFCPVTAYLAEQQGVTIPPFKNIGEGIVWVIDDRDPLTWFKVKGDKHRGTPRPKGKNNAPDEEGNARAFAFAEGLVDDSITSRLSAIRSGDIDLEASRENTGHFIGHVWRDFEEETKHLWGVSRVSKTKLNPHVSRIAREAWFSYIDSNE